MEAMTATHPRTASAHAALRERLPIELRAPAPRSGQAQMVHALGTRIAGGLYKPGEPLPPEAELMAEFGVSRTVLRECLKTLAAKGMVRAKTRVGTGVCARAEWNLFDRDVLRWSLDGGIDRLFLRHLAEIRLAVEPTTAALAAQRRTPEHLAALHEAVAAMRDAEAFTHGFAEADLAFHLALSDASGNPFMRSMGAVIETALLVSFQLSRPADAAQHDASWRAHAAILAAVERGDPADAAARVEHVIRQGLGRHGELQGLPGGP